MDLVFWEQCTSLWNIAELWTLQVRIKAKSEVLRRYQGGEVLCWIWFLSHLFKFMGM